MEIHRPIRNLDVGEGERALKCAAVEAVEARWKRLDRIKRRASFRKSTRNVLALLAVLVLAGGVAFCFLKPNEVSSTVEKARLAVLPPDKTVQAASPLVPTPLIDPKPIESAVKKVADAVSVEPDPVVGFQNRYAELVAVFRSPCVGLWKSAPESIRPKNVSPGTVYHALVARYPSGYDLYEIVTEAGGKMAYSLMSPLKASVKVSQVDFASACAPGYLIECAGAVYACGKASMASAGKLQERLGKADASLGTK